MIDWDDAIDRQLRAAHDASHVEDDCSTFHPSQLCRCKRQCTISKFGLAEHDRETLGVFEIGTQWHDWIERTIGNSVAGLVCERPVEIECDGITITGRCDVYDEVENAVYDFKTRSGWYKFDPPDSAHVSQLQLYMAAVGAEMGQVVYVSKKDLTVQTYPADHMLAFDELQVELLIEKATEIRDTLEDVGKPETRSDVPFERCDCWLCGQEEDS